MVFDFCFSLEKIKVIAILRILLSHHEKLNVLLFFTANIKYVLWRRNPKLKVTTLSNVPLTRFLMSIV